ncbi:hypothetical protein SDC9_202784 [bioreactor metagenome]|uniref:Uncharacterized protein n=1 Tax=bioreactor metagenome TaxID=1076179 RepID=A0A645IUK9_9ZZZZ
MFGNFQHYACHAVDVGVSPADHDNICGFCKFHSFPGSINLFPHITPDYLLSAEKACHLVKVGTVSKNIIGIEDYIPGFEG